MLFSDESKFCLGFTDRRQLVWRMPRERFDELKVAELNRYDKGSVMVWAGISVNGIQSAISARPMQTQDFTGAQGCIGR